MLSLNIQHIPGLSCSWLIAAYVTVTSLVAASLCCSRYTWLGGSCWEAALVRMQHFTIEVQQKTTGVGT